MFGALPEGTWINHPCPRPTCRHPGTRWSPNPTLLDNDMVLNSLSVPLDIMAKLLFNKCSIEERWNVGTDNNNVPVQRSLTNGVLIPIQSSSNSVCKLLKVHEQSRGRRRTQLEGLRRPLYPQIRKKTYCVRVVCGFRETEYLCVCFSEKE